MPSTASQGYKRIPLTSKKGDKKKFRRNRNRKPQPEKKREKPY
jgi:hypothetical protein